METCYRHPGRETGVACSNCGRPICTDCMTTTSVGMRCPECASQKTKVKTMGSVTDPQLTYILIGINVLVGLGSLLSGGGAGLFAGSTSLTNDGAVSRFFIENGEYWRLVTSGFLHYGIFHLLLNMFMLYLLGSDLEPSLGRLRFAIVYFVSLLGGSFGALLLEPNGLTAGASGAVFGLMGAAFVLMRRRGINPFETGLGLLLVLNILLSFRPGISLGGHLGGLVAGALATLVILELRERRGLPAWAPMLLAAAIGVLSVAGSIAVSASG
jgi:membrane associated rhomboid family serine protease